LSIAALLLWTLVGGAVGFILGFPLANLFISSRPSESIMVLPLGKIAGLLEFVIGSTLIGAAIGLLIGLRRR